MSQAKRIEITLTPEAAVHAKAVLVNRGAISQYTDFAGPVFDVERPKPGCVMTSHVLDCEQTLVGINVTVKYLGEGKSRSDVYTYPWSTVTRLKVTP